MKNLVFVADMFRSDFLGGAESNDHILIKHLESIIPNLQLINCQTLTSKHIEDGDFFIISNFVFLSERNKELLKYKSYIIYEHDHKYIKTRDPSVFPGFQIPEDQVINKEFYAYAKMVVVLSTICKEILQKTLQIDNVFSIGCSLWSDDRLDYIKTLIGEEKRLGID